MSLLDYVVEKLKRQANDMIHINDMRKWLEEYPWIVVLDGLDEVPPSGERPAILREIEAFFDEVATVKADVLVVVTTRPQGYNKDLSPQLWRHWALKPLGPSDAMRYAKRLTEVRLTEPARRSRVIKRLVDASKSAATAQLMVSPLQVAILFTLVDLKGDVPTDRWSLFDRYFAVFRDREEGKGGRAAELLRKYRSAVELVHHYTGFLLHVEAERSGGAEPFLTEEQFEELVSAFLAEEGHGGRDLALLATELGTLATERLVLLSCRVEKRIAFDVRSLQEFMAAAMVTAARDSLVEKRLRGIAGRSHWRHVFEIAASRCFSDTGKRHLADTVIGLCAELDAGLEDDADRIAKSGAKLALDLLADGLGADSPKYRKLLFDRAIGLLDLGPGADYKRLAGVVDEGLVAHLSDHIRGKIRAEGSRPALAAWALLIELTRRGFGWAKTLAEELWPSDRRTATDILSRIEFKSSDEPLFSLFATTVRETGFDGVLAMRDGYRFMSAVFDESFDNHYAPDSKLPRYIIRLNDRDETIAVSIVPISVGRKFRSFLADDMDAAKWAPFKAAAMFCESPNKRSLGNAIEKVASAPNLSLTKMAASSVPWPIASIIQLANGREELLALGRAAAEGEFGDIDDWLKAEQRWQQVGIAVDDLDYWESKGKFFGASVREVGAPSGEYIRIGVPRRQDSNAFRLFFDYFERATSIGMKYQFARLASLNLYHETSELSVPAQKVARWLVEYEHYVPLNILLRLTSDLTDNDDDLINTIDSIGREISLRHLYYFAYSHSHGKLRKTVKLLISMYKTAPNRRGILPILLQYLSESDSRAVEELHELPLILISPKGDDSPQVRAAAIGLSLISGKLSDEEFVRAVNDLVDVEDTDQSGSFAATVLSVVSRHRSFDATLRKSLSQLISRTLGKPGVESLFPLLRAALDAKYTGLDTEACWTSLGLPPNLYNVLLRIPESQMVSSRAR